MKVRELRAFLAERDGTTSVFEVRRPLVDLFIVTVSHPDDRGARPLLDLPDLGQCAKEGAGFDHGSVCAGQIHADHVAHLPCPIFDIEKVPRHRSSEPSHTGLVRKEVRATLTMVSVRGGQSGDRSPLLGTGKGCGHLSQPSGNGWLDEDTGRGDGGFSYPGKSKVAAAASFWRRRAAATWAGGAGRPEFNSGRNTATRQAAVEVVSGRGRTKQTCRDHLEPEGENRPRSGMPERRWFGRVM